MTAPISPKRPRRSTAKPAAQSAGEAADKPVSGAAEAAAARAKRAPRAGSGGAAAGRDAVPPPASGTYDPGETRTRLLDTAEALFAEHGFNGVSMRTITGAAGVNLAAAHYHFQSKEGLFRAVFERRVGPMNEERERLLQACVEDGERTGRLDLSAVLDAFISPAIRVSNSPGADNFRRLSGRASADPSPEVRRVVYELYDAVAARFVDLLARACPHLTREDLFWRLACAYGAMMYVRADSGRLQRLLGPDFNMSDSTAAVHHVIPVLAAGFALPSLATAETGAVKGRKPRGKAKAEAPAAPETAKAAAARPEAAPSRKKQKKT